MDINPNILKPSKKIPVILISIFVIILALSGVGGYLYVKYYHKVNTKSVKKTSVIIPTVNITTSITQTPTTSITYTPEITNVPIDETYEEFKDYNLRIGIIYPTAAASPNNCYSQNSPGDYKLENLQTPVRVDEDIPNNSIYVYATSSAFIKPGLSCSVNTGIDLQSLKDSLTPKPGVTIYAVDTEFILSDISSSNDIANFIYQQFGSNIQSTNTLTDKNNMVYTYSFTSTDSSKDTSNMHLIYSSILGRAIAWTSSKWYVVDSNGNVIGSITPPYVSFLN